MIRTSHRETGVIGAAIAAAVGLGWHPTLAAAADAMCPIERVFEPRPALAPLYAQRAERHDRARRHAIAQADAALRSVPSSARRDARSAKGSAMNKGSDGDGLSRDLRHGAGGRDPVLHLRRSPRRTSSIRRIC